MTSLDSALLLLAWIAWSLANLSARAKRVATAIEALQRLAERGRR